MNSNSPRFVLNGIDWGKIGKGLLVAVIGAILTYWTDVLKIIPLGEWTPIVMTFWSVIANVVRKWLTNYSPETPPTE